MSLGSLSGHEIVSCMVGWTLDGKDPEVTYFVGWFVGWLAWSHTTNSSIPEPDMSICMYRRSA